jgi:hypothetical protein
MKKVSIKKNVLGVFFLMSLMTTVTAQENEHQREVGIAFSDLNSFELIYKSGNAASLWRYNLLTTNFFKAESSPLESNNSITNISLGASIGKEYRELITKKLEYRFGVDAGLGFQYSKYRSGVNSNESINKTITYTPNINAILGVNYLFNEHLALGVEILPGVSYGFGVAESTNNGNT